MAPPGIYNAVINAYKQKEASELESKDSASFERRQRGGAIQAQSRYRKEFLTDYENNVEDLNVKIADAQNALVNSGKSETTEYLKASANLQRLHHERQTLDVGIQMRAAGAGIEIPLPVIQAQRNRLVKAALDSFALGQVRNEPQIGPSFAGGPGFSGGPGQELGIEASKQQYLQRSMDPENPEFNEVFAYIQKVSPGSDLAKSMNTLKSAKMDRDAINDQIDGLNTRQTQKLAQEKAIHEENRAVTITTNITDDWKTDKTTYFQGSVKLDALLKAYMDLKKAKSDEDVKNALNDIKQRETTLKNMFDTGTEGGVEWLDIYATEAGKTREAFEIEINGNEEGLAEGRDAISRKIDKHIQQLTEKSKVLDYGYRVSRYNIRAANQAMVESFKNRGFMAEIYKNVLPLNVPVKPKFIRGEGVLAEYGLEQIGLLASPKTETAPDDGEGEITGASDGANMGVPLIATREQLKELAQHMKDMPDDEFNKVFEEWKLAQQSTRDDRSREAEPITSRRRAFSSLTELTDEQKKGLTSRQGLSLQEINDRYTIAEHDLYIKAEHMYNQKMGIQAKADYDKAQTEWIKWLTPDAKEQEVVTMLNMHAIDVIRPYNSKMNSATEGYSFTAAMESMSTNDRKMYTEVVFDAIKSPEGLMSVAQRIEEARAAGKFEDSTIGTWLDLSEMVRFDPTGAFVFKSRREGGGVSTTDIEAFRNMMDPDGTLRGVEEPDAVPLTQAGLAGVDAWNELDFANISLKEAVETVEAALRTAPNVTEEEIRKSRAAVTKLFQNKKNESIQRAGRPSGGQAGVPRTNVQRTGKKLQTLAGRSNEINVAGRVIKEGDTAAIEMLPDPKEVELDALRNAFKDRVNRGYYKNAEEIKAARNHIKQMENYFAAWKNAGATAKTQAKWAYYYAVENVIMKAPGLLQKLLQEFVYSFSEMWGDMAGSVSIENLRKNIREAREGSYAGGPNEGSYPNGPLVSPLNKRKK